MPRLVSRTKATARAVPALRGDLAKDPGRAKQPSIPGTPESSAGIRHATREQGIAALLAPAIATGEGCRILIFGRTRWGKSSFAVHLVEHALAAEIASTALIHDVKYPDRAQYGGREVRSFERLGPAVRTAPIVVLRPPFAASDAAKAARLLSENGERTLLLIDETRRALGGAQKWIDADSDEEGPGRGPRAFEWLELEGGGVGASIVLLVQRPRQVPGDAIDSAQGAAVFGLGGRSLTYLVDAGTVPRAAADAVRRLQPGAFLVLADDEEWDRTIYYSPL